MTGLMRTLWQDEEGSILAGEWIFVATILVLGAVTGSILMQSETLSSALEPTATQEAQP